MPAVKITNKPVSTPGDQTHFLVTQPELPEGYAPTGQETEEELAELKVESLREIEMDDMVRLFQKKFAFDSEPTAESDKPVTSAGIKTALDAADAKIGELKENITNDLKYVVGKENYLHGIKWNVGAYISATGDITPYATAKYTDLIPVVADDLKYYYRASTTSGMTRIHGYDSNGDWVAQITTVITGTTVEDKYVSIDAEGYTYIRISESTTITPIAIITPPDLRTELMDEIEKSMGNFDFLEVSNSPNLFNPKTITLGYVVNNSGGHDNATYYAVSDYIPVSEGDIIRATPFGDHEGTTFQLYDSEKTWKTGTRWTQTAYDGYLEITIPSGISYVTVNLRGSNSNNVVVTKNTAFDASYGGTYGKAIGIVGGLYKGKLYGKKIAYNGDSICESRIVSGTANNGGAYAHLIAEATGAKYENRAISGGILASAVPSGQTMPQRSVVSDVTNMAADADLICFEGGINDYWKNVPLGDYSESDYSGTLDTTTVCGALESIIRQATNKWVGKPIVFIIVHKIKSTVYLPNSAGYTFAQEREKMIGICNKYSIPYYDAFVDSGLNAYNDIQNTTFLTSNSTGNPDGCHPNEAGYRSYYVPQLTALFESVMP